MKHHTELGILLELINTCQVVEKDFHLDNDSYKVYENTGQKIAFIGNTAIVKFESHTLKLYDEINEISETYPFKKFEKKILTIIFNSKFKSKEVTIEDVDALYKEILDIENIESEILYEIYGAEMKLPKLKFGDFTIYNLELCYDELVIKYPYLENKKLFFDRRKSDYFIGINVKARENDKAVENANKLAEMIENVFNYMIADLNHRHTIGINNYRGWRTTSAIICNNVSMGVQSKNHLIKRVNIEQAFFKDEQQGNDKVWELITKTNKTEIEKRLLNSIEWIGKGVYDLDISKTLVQFVFAIESMLQYNDKTIITPSIVSQMADWIAFVTKDDFEYRKIVSKSFKDIYAKRSAIAHGASKTISEIDIKNALDLSKLMVISFLVRKPFCEMKSMNELNLYLNDLKYK